MRYRLSAATPKFYLSMTLLDSALLWSALRVGRYFGERRAGLRLTLADLVPGSLAPEDLAPGVLARDALARRGLPSLNPMPSGTACGGPSTVRPQRLRISRTWT